MGRLLLVARLAARDLRRRRGETLLLLIAVLAATTTLTLGLVVREAAADPYESIRQATGGPDVVALADLTSADGVVASSGPFPVTAATITAGGASKDVQVVGRDTTPATVDQPKLTDGGWVRAGGVVLEAGFAAGLGVRTGDQVRLNDRTHEVVGLAVTAAIGSSCIVHAPCLHGSEPPDADLPPGLLRNPGLAWVTAAEVRAIAPGTDVVSYLKLADPNAAQAFADRYPATGVITWQTLLADNTELARDAQILLLIGAWLLGLLAVASLSVLVGGRMADQTRRVGLLKAVGGTPGLVAAVLLAEYLVVAVAAAAGGLAIGALTAPLLAGPGAGVPALHLPTILTVTAVALGVAAAATALPALRAARTSTVGALDDAPRAPRRVGWVIFLSRRLPVPLLLSLRIAARRPRRAVLAAAGIAVTVSGIYVLLILDAFLSTSGVYGDSQVAVLRRVLAVWTIVMLCLAAVNAIVIAWVTVLDNRHSTALVRALGATPGEVSTALAGAQVLPALAGALLGVPGGYLLFTAIHALAGGGSTPVTWPSAGQLSALVAGTVLVVALLTAVPSRRRLA